MLLPQVVSILKGKCEGSTAGQNVDIDAAVLQAAIEGLEENANLQHHIQRLEEQLSLKPTVARKLAKRITELELENETLRDNTRTKELEKKVQKLELDLKQSYSTKNFTLKKKLLGLEKQYGTYIYGNEAMQELWEEVMAMIAEDSKTLDGAATPALTTSATLTRIATLNRRNQQQMSAPHGRTNLSSATSEHGGDPAQEAGELDEAAPRVQEPTSQRVYLPNGGQHARANSMSTLPEGADGANAISSTMESLRAVFSRPGGPLFPREPSTLPTTLSGSGPSAGSGPTCTPSDAQASLDELNMSVDTLLGLWSQRTAKGGSVPVPQLLPGATGEVKSLEAQADAVLTSIQTLRDKFGSDTQDPGFSQQMDALTASIQQLRGQWSADQGGPLFPQASHTSSQGGRKRSDARASRTLTGRSAGPDGGMSGLRTQDLISYFMSFMQAQGYMPDAGKPSRTTTSQSSDGGTDPAAALPAALPPFEELLSRFNAYLHASGLPGAFSEVPAAGSQVAGDGKDALSMAVSDIPSWMPMLPALRLSTTASASGVSGAPVATLLDAAVPDAAPSWWAASLAAAGDQGDAAVQPSPADADPSTNNMAQPLTPVQEVSESETPSNGGEAAGGGEAMSSPGGDTGTPDATTIITTTPVAGATLSKAGSTGGTSSSGAAPAWAAPFNPLLLPGPARTMQAVMAHVRSRHADLLARVPEAEALLAEALAAASELQAAQDRSLIKTAVVKRAARSNSKQLSGAGLEPGAPPSTDTPAGEGLAAAGNQAGQGEQQGEAAAGEAQANGGLVPAVPAVEAEQPSADDYLSELQEVRSIAARHAEHAAALQELLARVAQQHASSTERADDLDMRLTVTEKEAAVMREELEELTRLLVETKMAFAERNDEAEHLSQQLRRTLASERAARQEADKLRDQLSVVGEDVVILESDYEDVVKRVLAGIELPPDRESAIIGGLLRQASARSSEGGIDLSKARPSLIRLRTSSRGGYADAGLASAGPSSNLSQASKSATLQQPGSNLAPSPFSAPKQEGSETAAGAGQAEGEVESHQFTMLRADSNDGDEEDDHEHDRPVASSTTQQSALK